MIVKSGAVPSKLERAARPGSASKNTWACASGVRGSGFIAALKAAFLNNALSLVSLCLLGTGGWGKECSQNKERQVHDVEVPNPCDGGDGCGFWHSYGCSCTAGVEGL